MVVSRLVGQCGSHVICVIYIRRSPVLFNRPPVLLLLSSFRSVPGKVNPAQQPLQASSNIQETNFGLQLCKLVFQRLHLFSGKSFTVICSSIKCIHLYTNFVGIDVTGYQNQQFKTRRLRLMQIYLFYSTRL